MIPCSISLQRTYYGVYNIMGHPPVDRILKFCIVCEREFSVGGRDGALKKKHCSKSCATKFRHRSAPNGLGDVNHKNMGRMKLGLEATKSPSNMELAWAAGLFEGEGSCQRKGQSCSMHVGQKDHWVCDRFKEYFGGHIGVGSMNGEPFYEWSASGARARGILMTLYSFLSPRRQSQALAAFAVAV